MSQITSKLLFLTSTLLISIIFIFSASLPTIKTSHFQSILRENNDPFTFTKNSLNWNSTFSTTSTKIHLAILQPSAPILPLFYTISATPHPTASIYSSIAPRLPIQRSLLPTFPIFYFNDLDSLNFSNFSLLWPQFRCCPAFNPRNPTTPTPQTPPTLINFFHPTTSRDPCLLWTPRLPKTLIFNEFPLKMNQILPQDVQLLPPQLRLLRPRLQQSSDPSQSTSPERTPTISNQNTISWTTINN